MWNFRDEQNVQRLGLMVLAVFLLLMTGGSAPGGQLAARAATHLLLTLLVAVWLTMRLRRRQFLPATPLNGPLFAGAAVITLSALFSLDPRMAAEHAWWPLIHALVFFWFAAQVQRGRQHMLFEALFLIGAITVIWAGAEFVSWLGRVGAAVDFGALLRGQAEFPSVLPMLSGPLYASTVLAGFVTPQVVVAFGWAATAQRKVHRLALAGLGVALALVLLGTGSRGGLLALAAAVITLLLVRLIPVLWAAIHGKQPGGGRVLLGLAAIGLVTAAALGLALTIGRSAARSSGDEIRVGLWANAASAARDYPLLGVGTGEVGRAFRLYHTPDQPSDFVHRQAHNIVLNTAAEEGIAGLAVLAWMSAALLVAWVRQRQVASGRHALRLEFVLAALVAVALQAQFDVFYITPFVALLALLAAYAVTTPGETSAPRRAGKVATWAALVLVIGYGLAWIPVHLAEAAFERAAWQNDRASAGQAAALDPTLRLYPLQVAYMEGQAAEADPSRLPEAIARYESGLVSEPAWDTGWLLLAGLYEQTGRIDDALAALGHARAINPAGPAAWNWARIADAHDAAPADAIIAAYAAAISQSPAPLAPEWASTPRRVAALEAVYAQANPRLRFLLAQAFFPERMADLVPANPQTADDWWVVGQYALAAEGDVQAAWEAFDRAVRLNPDREVGEYYAARARAGEVLGGEYAAQAARDRAMAALLITWQESAPRLADADRNFEQVLFLRSGNFRLPDRMIPPE
ncbi:MAG: O-antigen ligase family protein [Anaerolineae bacterium]|nr:O-antigen ligase family protein [Anaerolineae bacterium]